MFSLLQPTRDSGSPARQDTGAGATATYMRAAQQVGLDPSLSFGRHDGRTPILTLSIGTQSPFETRQMERRIHALVELENPRHFGQVLFRWQAGPRVGPATA